MKNLKKIAVALVCAALAASSLPVFATEQNINISFIVGADTVSINNTETEVTPSYIVDNTTLVPLRVIAEGLGAEVKWNEEDNSVSVIKDETDMRLWIGSLSAQVNDAEYNILAAPEIKEDTAMVPIRFISETLGAIVEWDQETMRVTISNAVSRLKAVDNTKWNYNAEDGVYWQVGVEYCANPVETAYETLGIFVPEAYMTASDNGDGTYTCELNTAAEVNGYTALTAPIVIPVETPGYSAMKAPTGYTSVSEFTDAGFVYVYAGCRGRDHGAPAGVTDLKAAVKYIRFNDGNIAGSTDRIFTFGMSGGGAQSALVGATGDSALYAPYLAAIGAAEGYSDAIAGSMCWCPITNLDYANEAYEWNLGISRSGLDEDMQKLSDGMAEAFAQYINEIGLKDENGNVLVLEESENGIYQAGSYYEYIKSEVERSLNNFLSDTEFPYSPHSSGSGFGGRMMDGELPDGMTRGERGAAGDVDYTAIDGISRLDTPSGKTDEDVTYETAQDYIDSLNSDMEWVIYDSETNSACITSVEDFVKACKNASKSVGAFDDLDKAQGENTLFGYGDGNGAHFDPIMAELLKDTEYGEAYAADLALEDSLGNTVDYRVNMYNPMYYLSDYYDGYQTANIAQYWRIRTGINQGDTALSTEINLTLALRNYGRDVDFETVWGQGHTKAERTGSSNTNFIEWVNECLK